MPQLTFWYEFASTYSYPAAMRIEALSEAAGVQVNWRPFLLGPIFKAQGWDTSPFNIYPAKGAYMWRDLARICADLDLPFRHPAQFPQNGLLAARVATFGLLEGWGVSFSKAVYRAQFGDGQDIAKGDLLRALVAEAGGDADLALEIALSDTNKAELRAATAEAASLKIFGAPTFVTETGEVFWGNDRLEQALRWAADRPDIEGGG